MHYGSLKLKEIKYIFDKANMTTFVTDIFKIRISEFIKPFSKKNLPDVPAVRTAERDSKSGLARVKAVACGLFSS